MKNYFSKLTVSSALIAFTGSALAIPMVDVSITGTNIIRDTNNDYIDLPFSLTFSYAPSDPVVRHEAYDTNEFNYYRLRDFNLNIGNDSNFNNYNRVDRYIQIARSFDIDSYEFSAFITIYSDDYLIPLGFRFDTTLGDLGGALPDLNTMSTIVGNGRMDAFWLYMDANTNQILDKVNYPDTSFNYSVSVSLSDRPDLPPDQPYVPSSPPSSGVPEPGSLFLTAAGLFAVLGMRRWNPL